jgi:hypothetical protein
MAAFADRRRRRRRIAGTALVAALALGLAVVGVLWMRSETARRRADAEAVRAEAGKLLALGEIELERYPTAALAYATKSLELADTEEARRLALRVLQDAPTAFVAPTDLQPAWGGNLLTFDPTGSWLALGGSRKVGLWHRDGREAVVLEGQFPSSNTVHVGFGRGPDGDVLIANQGGDLRMWSVSSGREIRRLKLDEQSSFFFVRGHNAVAWATVGRRDIVRWIPLVNGEPRLVGTMDKPASAPGVFVLFQSADVDEGGLRLAYAWGRNVYVSSLESWSSPARVVAAHPADVVSVALQPDGRTLAASDLSGGIRIWPTAARSERPLRVLENTGYSFLRYSGTGKWLGAWIGAPNVVRLFDLAAPLAGEALQLRGGPAVWLADVAFEPSDRWLATTIGTEIALWPLGER